MFDFDIIDLFVIFIAFILPASIFWTGLYLKKEQKSIIPISLLSAVITGIILQAPIEGHPHVPGSDILVIALVFIFTITVIFLTLIFRYIYWKIKNTLQRV